MASGLVSEEEFASTYDSSAYEVTQQYRSALSLAADTDLSQRAIADEVGRSTSAVRGWLTEDKTPRIVTALETARTHGWIDVSRLSETFRCLNQLVAWVFSGGGIRDDYFVPRFSVDSPESLAVIHTLFSGIGLSHRRIPDSQSDTEFPVEVKPDEAASILGRILHILGAPKGVKADNESLSLPDYLVTANQRIRADFARVYLANRLSLRRDNPQQHLGESRSTEYLQELCSFLADVTATELSVGSQGRIWIPKDGINHLAQSKDAKSDFTTLIAYGTVTPPSERSLAVTYPPEAGYDGWEYLQAYRKATADVSGSELDVPPEEIEEPDSQAMRNWNHSHEPDVVKSVQTASQHGWLSPSPTGETFASQNILAAWVLAKGSLSSAGYTPVFRFNNETQLSILKESCRILGVPWTIDDPPRKGGSQELRISEHGSIVGRLLSSLGAPSGSKTEATSVIPAYVYTSETHFRHYIVPWLLHYGSSQGPQTVIDLPSRYADRFVRLFRSLCESHPASHSSSGDSISFDSEKLASLLSSAAIEAIAELDIIE
jgi:hypothetical protein